MSVCKDLHTHLILFWLQQDYSAWINTSTAGIFANDSDSQDKYKVPIEIVSLRAKSTIVWKIVK